MTEQILLGAHESIGGGLYCAIERIEPVGGNCLQIFTKNSKFWFADPLRAEDITLFKEKWQASKVKDIIVHDSYLINLCSDTPEKIKKSYDSLKEELIRTHKLGIKYLVMHPGSHLKQGEQIGLKLITDNINELFAETQECSDVQVLLETTAGQGSNLGYRFEHLAEIINNIKDRSRIGVCFDTCHSFCAGYDIRTRETYEKTFAEFDKVIGLDLLKVFHLNDSKNDIGTRKDRHEHIAKGFIGKDAFSFIMNDARFAGVPKILETEKSEDLHEDKENIEFLLSLIS